MKRLALVILFAAIVPAFAMGKAPDQTAYVAAVKHSPKIRVAQNISLPIPLPLPRPAAAPATSAPTPQQVITNLQALTAADVSYAILLAQQAKTPQSNVRLQCWEAIKAALPTAPSGATMPPDPHLVTNAEQIAELIDGLQPTSPLFVNCAGAAQLAQLSVLQFVNAIVTGAAGVAAGAAILAPK